MSNACKINLPNPIMYLDLTLVESIPYKGSFSDVDIVWLLKSSREKKIYNFFIEMTLTRRMCDWCQFVVSGDSKILIMSLYNKRIMLTIINQQLDETLNTV